ncbi:MAG: rhodanese-like domain-containing protein, partial [Acidobacteria bacterium]|nr:rhodanese-like domain-containing protein [Acidobacteriota bacterium]
ARDPAEFESAHLAGSVNIGLGGQYATWAGTLLDPHKPIVIVAAPGREQEAAMRLGRIGFDRIDGYLEGGMAALAARSDLIRHVERVTATTLAEELASARPPLVLDVRTEREWRDKRIEGSLNIPLNQLPKRIAEVPAERRVVVHCASGYRSSIAAGLLQRNGISDMADLIGGISGWEASHLETATSASAVG